MGQIISLYNNEALINEQQQHFSKIIFQVELHILYARTHTRARTHHQISDATEHVCSLNSSSVSSAMHHPLKHSNDFVLEQTSYFYHRTETSMYFFLHRRGGRTHHLLKIGRKRIDLGCNQSIEGRRLHFKNLTEVNTSIYGMQNKLATWNVKYSDQNSIPAHLEQGDRGVYLKP